MNAIFAPLYGTVTVQLTYVQLLSIRHDLKGLKALK